MSTTFLVILSIVLIILGFVLALLFIPSLSSEGKASKQPVARDTDQPTEVSQPSPPARSLRVWRDSFTAKLIIEIDGQVHRSVAELSGEQRRSLSAIITDLAEWAGEAVKEAKLPAPPEKPPLPPLPVETPPVETTPTARGRGNIFLRAIQPGGSRLPPQPRSLAAQIDEILQEKLPFSSFSHHIIHLIELPNYGMSVQVDRNQYESIEAVPDEDIRRLIREAVEEWQRRNSPGRL